jgi:Uma2 family endonuclease
MFLVYADGTQIYTEYFSITDGTQMCGTNHSIYLEKKQFVTITIPHNSPSLTIIMMSSLNQDASDESWGIRDFSISIKPCPDGCVICNNNEQSECAIWINQEANWFFQNFGVDGWDVF